MVSRSNWFITASVFGILVSAGAPAARAGTASSCPTGSVSSAAFATANLGSTASTCGTVNAGANSVTTAIPSGFPGLSVEQWLGIPLDEKGFFGNSASVLRFDNFQAVLGSTVSFDWQGSFDPFTEGYAFVLLDGQKTVLGEGHFSESTTFFSLQNSQLTINSTGAHSLALGIVDGCFTDNCIAFNSSTLDPSATFSAITLDDPIGAPEPATLSLMAIGVGGMVIGLIRRKRS